MTSCVEVFVAMPLLLVRLTQEERTPQPAGPMSTSTSMGSKPDPFMVSLNGVYCFAGEGSVTTLLTVGRGSVGRLCKSLLGDPLPMLSNIPWLAFPTMYCATDVGVAAGCC